MKSVFCVIGLYIVTVSLAVGAQTPSGMAPRQLSVRVGGFTGPSYSAELKGNVVVCTSSEDPETPRRSSARPSQASWSRLRQVLDRLGVWNWKSAYKDPGTADGTQWSVKIEYADRKLISRGSNSYPTKGGAASSSLQSTEAFSEFTAAISSLVPGCRIR